MYNRDGVWQKHRFLLLVNPPFPVQGGKEIIEAADCLGTPQKQDARGVEGLKEKRDKPFLEICLKIDEEIPAAYEIELCEGGVHDDVLDGKEHCFPDFFVYLVSTVFMLPEILFKALRGYIRGNAGGEDALAGLLDRIAVDVGGEDLHLVVPLEPRFFQAFPDDYGYGVGLLSSRASRHPDPDRGASRKPFDQSGKIFFLQDLENHWVAEKARHTDKQFLEEQIDLLWVIPEIPLIIGQLFNLMEAHAPFDPADYGVLFVKRKVVPCSGPNEQEYLLKGARVLSSAVISSRGPPFAACRTYSMSFPGSSSTGAT